MSQAGERLRKWCEDKDSELFETGGTEHDPEQSLREAMVVALEEVVSRSWALAGSHTLVVGESDICALLSELKEGQ